MFTKTNRWFFAFTATLLVLLIGILNQPVQASAAQVADPDSNSCLTCHEDLYYLNDSGKLYCITTHKDRCVNCHEGNMDAMKKEEAHTGLILHPQQDDGVKCQGCHSPQEAQIHLAKFDSEAGFNTVIKAEAYTPSVEIKTGSPDLPHANPLVENWKWLSGSVLLLGLWLVLIFFSPLKP